MAKNPESDDQAKTGGPARQQIDQSAQAEFTQRVDRAHAAAPGRPNFLSIPQSAATQSRANQTANSHLSAADSTTRPTQSAQSNESVLSFDSGADYLPPKLRQRMQALMAELSLEVEPPAVSNSSEILNSQATDELITAEPNRYVAASEDVTTETEALVIPAPGELVELPVVEASDSVFDDIDPDELALLGIETHPIQNDHDSDSPSEIAEDNLTSTIPFQEIPFQEITESPVGPTEVTLETAKYLDPALLAETEDESELVNTTESFSQQAGEIVEILKRRQAELSRYREQLEIGKARTENELRQQRLELVEKKREFLEEVTQFRMSQKQSPAPASPATAEPIPREVKSTMSIGSTSSPLRVVSSHADSITRVPSGVPAKGRRITLESIAMPSTERASENDTDHRLEDAPEDHLDRDFLDALERHLGNPVDAKHRNLDLSPTQSVKQKSVSYAGSSISESSISETRLRQQAATLKKQHSAAIGSLQKTRRQLELLRNVVVQQQQQTAERACDLDQEHESWNATRSHQQQELEVDRRELDRLTSIRENELSKRETATLQRENAVKQLESKLQQAQVEILRDRVIIRQLERTARQTLSNTQWNDRLAIITEETEGYLQSMKERAEAMKAEAGQQIKRLDSRQSELLLYRESLRNWVQRQMKLISRRAAHLEEREDLIQQRWHSIAEARQELQEQQSSLNEILREGLDQIDDQLDVPPTSRIQDAA